MNMAARILLAPVFGFVFLVVAITLDDQGWLRTGLWVGQSEGDALMHSLMTMGMGSVLFFFGTAPCKKPEVVVCSESWGACDCCGKVGPLIVSGPHPQAPAKRGGWGRLFVLAAVIAVIWAIFS